MIRKYLVIFVSCFLIPGAASFAAGGNCETLTYQNETVNRCFSTEHVFFKEGTWQEAVSKGLARHKAYERVKMLQYILDETGVILKGNI